MAGGIATIEKHSMLAWRAWHWHHHLIQSSRALYMTQAPLDSGVMSAAGGRTTLDVWMQESHGPTITLNDNDTAGLLVSIELGGRDQFGDYKVTKMLALNDPVGAGTGSWWQCPQPYSWLDYIKILSIAGAAASDTIDVGIFRGSNNGVWYGAPCDMSKSGLPVASLFSNQDNNLVGGAVNSNLQDTSIPYNALRYNISVSALLEVTTIFDPRKARF